MYRGLFFLVMFVGSFLVASGTHALSISPTKQSLSLDPGSEKTIYVQVMNDAERSVRLNSSVDAFRVDENTGAAMFGASDPALRWIDIDPYQTTVASGQTATIAYTIRVPEDVAPGAHYLGLFAQNVPEEGDIAAGTRIGSLLYLYVAGTMRESLVRQNFAADHPFFITSQPTIFLHLFNEGNIHVLPQGTVVATDMFGRQIGEYIINSEQIKVFPGASFARPIVLEDVSKTVFGPIDVRAHITYGLSEQTINTHTRIWIFSPVFFAIVATIFALILSCLFFIRRRV